MENRIFVNRNNKATFLCPKCDNLKTVDVSKFVKQTEHIRFNCRCKNCGHTYPVVLERRKYERKDTNLPGMVTYENEEIPVIVTDISPNGLQWMMKDTSSLQTGTNLDIVFELDNAKKTKVFREVIIRKIGKYFVGGEFPSDGIDADFTLYLQTLPKG